MRTLPNMPKTPERSIKKKPGMPIRSAVAATGETLQHLAFDNSILAHIITTLSSGKIVSANNAASKLFGYSKKGLLARGRSAIFDIKEASFKTMLKQRIADGQSKAIVTAIKKSGKHFSCEITSAIFMDEHGVEKAITTIADMSESIQKQKGIDTEKEKIVAADIVTARSKQKTVDIKKEKVVADNIALAKSKQKVVDIKKEKIVAENIIIAKSKQKTVDVKNEKIVAKNIALVKSKQKEVDIKKEKTVADNIILARSKQKGIDVKKEKIVSADIERASARSDKARISYANTVRNQLLAEIEKGFRSIFNSSSDVLFDSDLVANTVTINDAYEKEFGYKKKDRMAPAEDWLNHIHPDDKELVMQDYFRMLASGETEWKYSFRFLKADNSVVNVLSKGIVLRNHEGMAYRRIGYLLDISKQKVLEEKLEQQIRLREQQFEEAMEDAKDTERSDIGKELHDNVNQLLGASRMYLEMAKRGGVNSEMYLSRSSEYTLTAIEEIRRLTKGLTTDFIRKLGLCDAIDNLARDTMETSTIRISYACGSFKESSVNDKFKLNVYRIVQEQLNNILKHAKATRVIINLLQNKKSTILSISDNGIGFDTGKKIRGIGIENIKSRAASNHGTADFVSEPGFGCVLTAKFPTTFGATGFSL